MEQEGRDGQAQGSEYVEGPPCRQELEGICVLGAEGEMGQNMAKEVGQAQPRQGFLCVFMSQGFSPSTPLVGI